MGAPPSAVLLLQPPIGPTAQWTLDPKGGACSREGVAGNAVALAWRHVVLHDCGIELDAELGLVHLETQPQAPIFLDERDPLEERRTSGVFPREQEASVLLAVPLRRSDGKPVGMLALQFFCREAAGRPGLFGPCASTLGVLAEGALAALLGLSLLSPVPTCTTTDPLLPVVGQTMRGLVARLRVFARQSETILLMGPTGVGKSRLAQWCHAHSPRAQGPLETLDLATVPEDLQMPQLFGWRKGAFTGALRDTPGAIARAEHGTLFLDEIDKLSLRAQAGLLRVLEERRYRPVGHAEVDQSADVRFLVGTNARLGDAVREGTFRQDLFFRIHVLPLKIPALGERPDELLPWCEFMLRRRHLRTHAEGRVCVGAGCEALLRGFGWPGNLRQLDNIVSRAYALALTERGVPGVEFVLDARDLETALGLEEDFGVCTSLPDSLRACASVFLREAERLSAIGRPLDLDLSGALGGFVLTAAVERAGNIDAALRLLGKDNVVRGRNQHRVLRQYQRCMEDLLTRLQEASGTTPSPISGTGS